jgi:hypothetical protein
MPDIFLNLNKPEAVEVFRQNHITLNGVEGLRQGYTIHGDKFMFDILKAISPKSSVLNGNFNDYLTVTPTDTAALDANINSDLGLSAPKRTFDDWMRMIGQAGNAISGLKQSILGTPAVPDVNNSEILAQKNSAIIYIVAVVLVIVIGILIFKPFKS